MSEQCKVSEPAALADDTEGGAHKRQVTGISPPLAQVRTKMPLQTTNSAQNNLMFLVRFWVLKQNVELVWTWTFMLQDDHVMGVLGFSKPIASEKQMKSCCCESCLKLSRFLSLLPSHSHQCVMEYFFSFYLHIWAVSQKPYRTYSTAAAPLTLWLWINPRNQALFIPGFLPR